MTVKRSIKKRRLSLQQRAFRALEKNTRLLLNRVERDGKPLTAQGKAQLEAIANGHTTGQVPAYVYKASELASILTETFHTEIPRQYINKWEKSERTFPNKEKASGRYHVGSIIEWCRVKKHYGEANGSVNGETNGELFSESEVARKEIDVIDRDRARFEFEKSKGMYVTKVAHERAMVALAKTVQPIFEQALEHLFPQRMVEVLQNHQAAPELIAAFLVEARAHGAAIVDEIKNQFAANA